MIPLKFNHIRGAELNNILDKAVALPRFADLLYKTEFSNTSIEDVPLLQIRLGPRIVGDINADIFKLDDGRFAVYVTSKNRQENRYFYSHTHTRNNLKTLLRIIIKTFKQRYCRLYSIHIRKKVIRS